jgi:putative membrane protein
MKYLFVCAAIAFICADCSHNDNDNTTVSNADSYFMQQASYSNYAEISAGAIAASKGGDDSVRMFGSMMVADHGNAQSSLDSIASSLNVTVPNTADSVHQAMAAQLQTLSGNTFDTAYINAQVKDHMATIAIFQQEISGGNNAQVKAYANKNLPIIQMHLQEAQSIQQRIQ